MKTKATLAAISLAALSLFTACTDADTTPELVTVRLGFNGFETETAPMTRASVGDYVNHLDFWPISGTDTTVIHQQSSDADFGTYEATLNNQKEYTLYAVAHKVNGNATLSNNIISFPDNKVTHTFFISRTFTPTKNMSLDLTMQRIVAQFSLTTTDEVPDWCKTIRFTIFDVYDRWNISSGGTHLLNRVTTFENFSTKQDGTVTCNLYAIVEETSTDHDILIEALDADGNIIESHTLTDVPLRNNYRTVASGVFFSDAASAFTFQAQNWAGDFKYDF